MSDVYLLQEICGLAAASVSIQSQNVVQFTDPWSKRREHQVSAVSIGFSDCYNFIMSTGEQLLILEGRQIDVIYF